MRETGGGKEDEIGSVGGGARLGTHFMVMATDVDHDLRTLSPLLL
jgi:hypothetical protein